MLCKDLHLGLLRLRKNLEVVVALCSQHSWLLCCFEAANSDEPSEEVDTAILSL